MIHGGVLVRFRKIDHRVIWAFGLLGVACASTPKPQANPVVPPQPKALEEPMVDARVVTIRILHRAQNSDEPPTPQHITEMHHGSIVRMERGGIGIVPAMTLLWDFDQAKGWIVDDAKEEAAPLNMGIRDVTPASRSVVARELGFALDPKGAMVIPQTPLEPVSATSPAKIPVGAENGSGFRVRDATEDHEVQFWVAQGLPLDSLDYAKTWRRRLPPPWSADEERLLQAFEALPGYPIEVRIERNGWYVVHRVISAVTEPRPARLFEVPTGYTRRKKGLRMLIDTFTSAQAKRKAEGRVKLGLDRPFVPSPAQRIPPALPGGSCQRDLEGPVCVEAWDGSEVLFSENCKGRFDFERACARKGLSGVCESKDRMKLVYFYGADQAPACVGRWYPAVVE